MLEWINSQWPGWCTASAAMSCLTALDSQIVSLLSVPHEILFLQHKVFREYAKIAVGPDFIHTLPSFLILTSMAIVLWRNPPCCNGLAESVASTMVYKGLQVSSYRVVSDSPCKITLHVFLIEAAGQLGRRYRGFLALAHDAEAALLLRLDVLGLRKLRKLCVTYSIAAFVAFEGHEVARHFTVFSVQRNPHPVIRGIRRVI